MKEIIVKNLTAKGKVRKCAYGNLGIKAVAIQENSGAWSMWLEDEPGIITQGPTKKQALENLKNLTVSFLKRGLAHE